MYIGRDACDAHGGRARGRAHEEVAAPILQQPRLSETGAMNGDSGPHPRTPRPSPMRQEVGTCVAGGATRDVAMQTGAQLSSDSGPHVQARRALRGRFSDSRISRPLGVACGASARSANAWREGQPEMWRCKQAGSCPPTEIRRRNGAASLPTLGVRSHRCLHT